MDKVPTREGATDTVRFDSDTKRFSIHFDPAFPERKGSFQYTDRMDPPENMRGKIGFFGKDLPVIPGATLTFTDDIDALRAGKPGMTVALDSDSDGHSERTVHIAPGPPQSEWQQSSGA